ncbi:hypothetical protein J8N05_46735 (plasmid) [Streptomyces sp. BH-SS-21]|uniref:Uncharacterized protein n=1 Tax=Streptomyces liliiviolaceus TaxID=2823109 RepID=A0A941BJ63_9ACTN|nr:hypothetical protein [Streptomyces liliiviolaceus]MBQ0855659.1 hypothetical protein [Streptomyces liliiviolaceus]
MNVARPGRPLGPVAKGLQLPVSGWVQVFRTVVVEQLLGGEDPLTLEQVSAHLMACAVERPDERLRPVGAAGADRLQSVQSGRGETSVQRMVSGRLVPTRDVVLDLLQLLEDRGLRPGEADLEELWRLYRPALRSRRPDVAEAYDIIDERDAAQSETAGLRQQVGVLQADQRRALLSLTRAGVNLLGAHRALAASQKELTAATDSREFARAEEHEARAHLEAAVDRLDRLKDAYEQMREQAETLQREAAADRTQWQERQALLLERLAHAEEALAQAVHDAEGARRDLEHERRTADAAFRTAREAQRQATAGQADAVTARQEAAAAEARRLQEAAAAQHALSEAEGHHTQAMNAITHLEAELRQTRTELWRAQQRLLRADNELVQAMRERAVEADAQDVLSQALTALQTDGWSTGRALIPAGPESTTEPRPEGPGPVPGRPHTPPAPDAAPPLKRLPKQTSAGAAPPTGTSAAAPHTPGGKAGTRTAEQGPAGSQAEAAPREGKPAAQRAGTRPRKPEPDHSLGHTKKIALVAVVAVAVAGGVSALAWWSWDRDTSRSADRESPTPSATAKQSKVPSLPAKPAQDSVADIGDQPVNTAAIMKLPVCAASAVSPRVRSERNVFTDRDPRLTLTVKAASKAAGLPCRVNVGRGEAVLMLTPAAGDAAVWKSSQCASDRGGPRWLELTGTRPVTVDFRWNRRSSRDCSKDTAAPYGTYLAEAVLKGAPKTQSSFVLAGEEAEQPVRTPSTTPPPQQPDSSPEETDSSNGSSGGSDGGFIGGPESTPSSTAPSPSDDPTGADGANGGGDGGDNGGLFGGSSS